MAFMPIPIPIPIVIPMTNHQSSGNPIYIKSNKGTYINISAATECDTYECWGSFWVRFCINGSIKYYAESYNTKDEAEKALMYILTYERKD